MNKRMWELKMADYTHFWRNEKGEAMIGFGLVLPILVLLSVSILEFSLIIFDYHRAGEATRRAARSAAIADTLVDQDVLAAGAVLCVGSGSSVSCDGADVDGTTFNALLVEMRAILPKIAAENVQIEYSASGLGDASTPGGLIPLVTVRLVNLQHDYLMLSGFPTFGASLTYPPLTTSRLAGGMGG